MTTGSRSCRVFGVLALLQKAEAKKDGGIRKKCGNRDPQ
jgi:hypothetical protein